MIYDDYYFIKRVSQLTPEPTKPAITSSAKPTKSTIRKYLDLPFAEMVYIPGGTFQMGDAWNEERDHGKPVHSVTVSSFMMGKYEVTQRQWEAVMGTNPSHFKDCPDCPVEQVSWKEVQKFLKKLNDLTDSNYRLPTEAEWEYAAGGGSGKRTRFGNGQDVIDPAESNFDGSSNKNSYSVAGEYRGKTVRVGSFQPNGLGLYDMSGNITEWCADWYEGDYYASTSSRKPNPIGPASGFYRVLRGGSWTSHPYSTQVTLRGGYIPSNRYYYVGFRIVSHIQ